MPRRTVRTTLDRLRTPGRLTGFLKSASICVLIAGQIILSLYFSLLGLWLIQNIGAGLAGEDALSNKLARAPGIRTRC